MERYGGSWEQIRIATRRLTRHISPTRHEYDLDDTNVLHDWLFGTCGDLTLD